MPKSNPQIACRSRFGIQTTKKAQNAQNAEKAGKSNESLVLRRTASCDHTNLRSSNFIHLLQMSMAVINVNIIGDLPNLVAQLLEVFHRFLFGFFAFFAVGIVVLSNDSSASAAGGGIGTRTSIRVPSPGRDCTEIRPRTMRARSRMLTIPSEPLASIASGSNP